MNYQLAPLLLDNEKHRLLVQRKAAQDKIADLRRLLDQEEATLVYLNVRLGIIERELATLRPASVPSV